MSPEKAYQALVAKGAIVEDVAQAQAAAQLDRLFSVLTERRSLRHIFQKKQSPRGIYLYGDVGRGKSMLMDLFFEQLPLRKKRRVHFHAFMQEVHERIFKWRQLEKKGAVKQGDPIPPVAKEIAAEASVLCFDEFQVKDIADASILGRLFTQFFEAGITIVVTSNRHPDDLYKGGLHRDRFLPFIALVKDSLLICELTAAKDFRLNRLSGHPVWFTPVGISSREHLDARFKDLTGGVACQPVRLSLKGRVWDIAETALGVARMRYEHLCVEHRGAGDYLALAQRFHTVIIDGIPRLTKDKRNEAVRFVTLIDALYEHKVKLLASADSEPAQIYPDGDGAFEFQRTVSRLMEMRSEAYLALAHMSDEAPSGTELTNVS
ncbi:cell division protein ZapE [Alphaproteobacteria bacterium]|jgi:cell division protein ZapE|nr:cell division protein ZapE [Alphaproteobacteria bacterium]